ncbi:unnamed protein product [Allacma fusca]|uniref:Uncharacterized protein n=1 Tax=Allacma fusca TaxID=39272 RepID=A0A8J2JXQ0_9HEXA|nr:unnamed protein product [Allacma fusca]
MSSPNCLRSAVPPKSEKDKVSLSLSSPRGDPLAVVSPGMKQTVGTQVNILMMRQPSPALSSSGTRGCSNNRPVNFPRPIALTAESKVSLLPPPPLPRQRKNRLSVSSSRASPTSQTESNSHNRSKPVCATVDKKKKWATRMQNQQEQLQEQEHLHVNNNSEKVSEDSQVQSVSQEQDKNSQELIVTMSQKITEANFCVCR